MTSPENRLSCYSVGMSPGEGPAAGFALAAGEGRQDVHHVALGEDH